MKKNKVLKTGSILFIIAIAVLFVFNKTKNSEESLFSNDIEALATGEWDNSSCQAGSGFCEYNNHVIPGLVYKK